MLCDQIQTLKLEDRLSRQSTVILRKPQEKSYRISDQINSNKREPFKAHSIHRFPQAAKWIFLAALIGLNSALLCETIQLASANGALNPQFRASSEAEPYQLIGQVGNQAQLPCLVGKRANCGEPYFVAWYKFNGTSRLWTRIEHRSDDEQVAAAASSTSTGQHRFHLTWPTLEESSSFKPTVCNQAGEQFNNLAGSQSQATALNLACAHLTIRSLEPADEGQYKCEITFSDSIDFDRCPSSTLSQLNVIGKRRPTGDYLSELYFVPLTLFSSAPLAVHLMQI